MTSASNRLSLRTSGLVGSFANETRLSSYFVWRPITECQLTVSARVSSLFITLNALRAVIEGYLLLPVALVQPATSAGALVCGALNGNQQVLTASERHLASCNQYRTPLTVVGSEKTASLDGCVCHLQAPVHSFTVLP